MHLPKRTIGFLACVIPLLVTGCGDEEDRLSAADIAYIRQQRYQAQYGTATSTVVATVTITTVTTITESVTTIY